MAAEVGDWKGGSPLGAGDRAPTENFGAPIRQICQALRVFKRAFWQGSAVCLPRPSQPEYSNTCARTVADLENVHLVDPLDYLSLIHLIRARLWC